MDFAHQVGGAFAAAWIGGSPRWDLLTEEPQGPLSTPLAAAGVEGVLLVHGDVETLGSPIAECVTALQNWRSEAHPAFTFTAMPLVPPSDLHRVNTVVLWESGMAADLVSRFAEMREYLMRTLTRASSIVWVLATPDVATARPAAVTACPVGRNVTLGEVEAAGYVQMISGRELQDVVTLLKRNQFSFHRLKDVDLMLARHSAKECLRWLASAQGPPGLFDACRKALGAADAIAMLETFVIADGNGKRHPAANAVRNALTAVTSPVTTPVLEALASRITALIRPEVLQ
jgi:hypothetical protein